MRPESAATAWHRRDWATGAAVALAAVGTVFSLIAYSAPHLKGIAFVTSVTAVVAGCGVALCVVIRLVVAAPASVGQWLRRSAAGALLLTPAAMLSTQPFLAAGWDFDTCGSLVDRHRRTEANLADFQSQCDIAAHGRLVQVLVWAAVGCAAVVAYGLWSRRHYRGPRPISLTGTAE